MAPKISEIRIRHISNMSEKVRMEVMKMASPMGSDFRGFVKVTYVTESPKRIHTIEPIKGSARNFIEQQNQKEGISIPSF